MKSLVARGFSAVVAVFRPHFNRIDGELQFSQLSEGKDGWQRKSRARPCSGSGFGHFQVQFRSIFSHGAFCAFLVDSIVWQVLQTGLRVLGSSAS